MPHRVTQAALDAIHLAHDLTIAATNEGSGDQLTRALLALQLAIGHLALALKANREAPTFDADDYNGRPVRP